jgi:hypothetical protein
MTPYFDQCGHPQVLKSLSSVAYVVKYVCRSSRCVCAFELVGCVLSCCVLCCVSCSLEEIVSGSET